MWIAFLHCLFIVYFADNSLLFPTVKELSKSVNSWGIYCKKFEITFFVCHHVL